MERDSLSTPRAPRDAEKQRAYYAKWYEANRERHIANQTERNRVNRIKVKALVREAKARPCSDCGVEYPYYVMQFDHVRGEKKFTIAAKMNVYTAPTTMQREIEKCDVVCANCHAIRTWQRANGNGVLGI